MRKAVLIETMAPTMKGKGIDLPNPDLEQETDTCFEALLYPNRSLPNTGFVALMSVVIGVNLALGLVFTLQGAWPVLAFGGLDIVLVWAAFKTSYRQGRLHERVRLTDNNMVISRVLPSGHEMRWVLHPYWTEIAIDDPVHHESQLQLKSKGKTLILGAFLSPKERLAFGKRLSLALQKATAGPLMPSYTALNE